MEKKLGTVIATRTLKISKTGKKVLVKIGQPRRGKKCWFCPCKIAGIKNGFTTYIYGEDAIQALMLALEFVRIVLEGSREKVTWADFDDGFTGFPRYVNYSFGMDLYKRLNQMLDKEEERFHKAIKAKYAKKRAKPHR